MSIINSMSSIVVNPDMDLFGVPPTQLTVERDLLTEHRPISIINSNSIIQFNIQSGLDEYIQLRECLFYLKIKVNIKKADSSAVAETDWEKLAPVNYLLHSI